MAAIHWVAVEPATGVVIEELPGLRVTSSVPVILGRSGGGVSAELPVMDRLPDRWRLATEPARTLIVACYDDPDRTVLWAGWVTKRTVSSDAAIQLSMSDVPDFLARTTRLPGMVFGYDTDGDDAPPVEQTTIMRALGLDLLAATFHGTVLEVPSGVTRRRTYAADEDKTRLEAIQQLQAVIDGCEWVIGWQWNAAGALECLITVAQTVGRRPIAGWTPPTFSQVGWERVEDYSDGKGATIVTGVATREGDDRLSVTFQDDVLLGAGYLPIEHRYSPDTGSVNSSILGGYVGAKLESIRLGSVSYNVTMDIAESDLILGRDVTLGDDVTVDLVNPDLPDLDHSIYARLVGWVAEPDPDSGQIVQIQPVFWTDEES